MEEREDGAKTSGSTPLFGGASPGVERPAEQVAEADANVLEDLKWPSPDSSISSASNSESNLYDTSNSDGNEAQDSSQQLKQIIGGQTHDESRKRKSVSSLSGSEKSNDCATASKKVRLESPATEAVSSEKHLPTDRSLLPAEIWHHVFTFCSPSTLGNLLQVSKLFNKYLDPTSSVQRDFLEKLSRTAVECLDPNLIWQISRRRFWPSTPSPYDSKTQLDMWRLAFSKQCQWCGKRSDQARQPSHDSLRGPGQEGVSVIWQFATRTCGPCLAQRSLKEIDLLLSSTIPPAIIPALPHVYATPDHQVAAASRVDQEDLAGNANFVKLYWNADVQALKTESIEVRKLGDGTVGEWIKGLPGRGKDKLKQATKWEKWEDAGRPLLNLKSGPEATPSALQSTAPVSSIPGLGGDFTTMQAKETHNVPEQQPKSTTSAHSTGTSTPDQHSVNSAGPPSGLGLPKPPSSGNHSIRPERTKEQVAELKHARRAEIERRALLLTPPLGADALIHMPSFQAATQIITPLDDNAWEVLKPRLLAQRADAESKARENAALAQSLRKADVQPTTSAAVPQEVRVVTDKEWDEVQGPVRARIAMYADEIIRDGWDNGKKLSKEDCSKFAVEVLLHVRKLFYAQVNKDIEAARVAGLAPVVDPPEGPFTQKLTLENLKWIFDLKIRPCTEHIRKEIFYCPDCESNHRAYGLEGIIQHYAAKHTSALSLGNIVVHWRAEWPEKPPFSSGPHRGQSTNYNPPPYPPGLVAGHGLPLPPPNAAAGIYPTLPPGVASQPLSVGGPFASPYGNPGVQASYPAPVNTGPPGFHQHIGPPGPVRPPLCSYGQPAFLGPQSALSSQIAAPASGQLGEMARDAREVWNATTMGDDLPGDVKVFTMVHHVVKRFRSKFGQTPPLLMFIDGLTDNKDMRPVRNVFNLACKACALGLGNAPYIEPERTRFSLPQLTKHFQTKHIEPMQSAGLGAQVPLDWTVDMVHIPNSAAIHALRKSIDPNSRKFYLLADAFPDIFGPPASAPTMPQRALSGSQQYSYPAPTQQHSETGSNIGSIGSNQRLSSHGPMVIDEQVGRAQNARYPMQSGQSPTGDAGQRLYALAHDSSPPQHYQRPSGPKQGQYGVPGAQADLSNREPRRIVFVDRQHASEHQPLARDLHAAPAYSRSAEHSQFGVEPAAAYRDRAHPGPYSADGYTARRTSDMAMEGVRYDRAAPEAGIAPVHPHASAQYEERPMYNGHYDAEQRMYEDERRSVQSRPVEPRRGDSVPGEVYEIVQVRDETGEYYIRRPVRRQPEPQHQYEGGQRIQRAVRDPGYDPAGYGQQTARQPGHGQPQHRPMYDDSYTEARPAHHQPVRRPPQSDSAFDEEYDPRFPAAPSSRQQQSPTGMMSRQPRY